VYDGRAGAGGLSDCAAIGFGASPDGTNRPLWAFGNLRSFFNHARCRTSGSSIKTKRRRVIRSLLFQNSFRRACGNLGISGKRLDFHVQVSADGISAGAKPLRIARRPGAVDGLFRAGARC